MINLKRLPKGLAIGADTAYRRAPVIYTVVTLCRPIKRVLAG